MRTLKILAAIFALAAGAVAAQPPGPPSGGPPGGPGNLDRLSVLLDLDSYQKTEVGKILDEQRQAREAARSAFRSSGERPSFEAMEAQRKAQEQDTLTKLQGVLTETQITKFKLLTERPNRPHPPFRHDAPGQPPPAVL